MTDGKTDILDEHTIVMDRNNKNKLVKRCGLYAGVYGNLYVCYVLVLCMFSGSFGSAVDDKRANEPNELACFVDD